MRNRIRSYQIRLEVVAPNTFRCYIYNCKFTDPDERRVLEHAISDHNKNVCVKCKLEFPSRQEKKKHMEKRHSI